MNNRFFAGAFAIVFMLPIAASLGGCAYGNTSIAQEDASTLEKKIVKGKTTKAQILAFFGEPFDKGTQNGREYWSYRTSKASVGMYFGGLGDVTSKDITIYFDKAGVVTSYDTSQTKG